MKIYFLSFRQSNQTLFEGCDFCQIFQIYNAMYIQAHLFITFGTIERKQFSVISKEEEFPYLWDCIFINKVWMVHFYCQAQFQLAGSAEQR